MKKTLLILMLLCTLYVAAFAQNTIYVSAKGNDANSGQSEAMPKKTLRQAFVTITYNNDINKIIVIGTLDIISEESDDPCFLINNINGLWDGRELLITGKPGVSGTERAVLSGKGSSKRVLGVLGVKVRFEHIEISGGVGEGGNGLIIVTGAQVTMGIGSSVRNNAGNGIVIARATCVIDGGEVSNNTNNGVDILKDGVLTLRSGTIRDNRAISGGGVLISEEGGRFTMSGGIVTGNSAKVGGGVLINTGGCFEQTGGSINGNTAERGGGVLVMPNGRYDQTGGNVSNNTASEDYPNICRLKGSLGSNL